MRIRFNIAVLLFLVVTVSGAQQAIAQQELFHESKNQREGSTRVKGSGVVTQLANGGLKADVDVNVRKSGVSGTGKGSLSLILFDAEGKPFRVVNAGRTVGADAINGVADKSDNASLTLFPAFAQNISGAQLDIDLTDDRGYPTSLPDLIARVGDLNKRLTDAGLPSFKDLQVGQTVQLGNSVIKKFR